MRDYKLFIGGAWVDNTDGEVMDDFNPATGALMARVHMAGAADAEKASPPPTRPVPRGGAPSPTCGERLLLRAADVMEARAEELTELIIAESGSTRYKARGEVLGSAGVLRVAAGECRRIHGEVLQPTAAGQVSMAVRAPWAWCWALPLQLPADSRRQSWPTPSARGTLHPQASPLTPAIGLAIAEVFEAAGPPAGVLNVVPGRSEVIGDLLVDDPRVKMVTPPAPARWDAPLPSGRHGIWKKVAMELGAKSHDCPGGLRGQKKAADIAAYGAFCHQGQVCMATSRIIVEEPVYEAFCAALVRRAEGLKVGGPREEDTIIGPLIQPNKWEFIDGPDRRRGRKGAGLLTGAGTRGRGYWPTVLSGVTPEMRIFREETFGPVTSVVRAPGRGARPGALQRQ